MQIDMRELFSKSLRQQIFNELDTRFSKENQGQWPRWALLMFGWTMFR